MLKDIQPRAGDGHAIANTAPITGIDPASLDYKAAHAFLPQTSLRGIDYEREILDLIEADDFWQNARRYVGPMPAPGAGYLAGMEVLERSFAPVMKLREVLRRHVRGVCGREPQFEIVLMDEDGTPLPLRDERSQREDSGTRNEIEALADEADDLQNEVWDERGEHKIAHDFASRLRATGTAYLRYDIPPGLIVEGIDRETGAEAIGVPAEDAATWQDAYRLFHKELVPRGAAYIHTDRATMCETAFYSYEEPRPSDPKQTRKCVQVSWLEKREGVMLTRVRVVRDDGSSDDWELDTGGRLLVIEAKMERLLTPDLLRLQDIICSQATMIKINGDVAGFPQTTAIDMAIPAKVASDGTREEAPLQTGPRTFQVLYSYMDRDAEGNPLKDDKGKPIIRSGTIQYREPVDSTPLRDDADWFEKQIYLAVNQEHIVARRSANAAAAMLVEMRADYADSLLETKPDFEKALREVFHARLCAAAYLAGDGKTLERFKAGRVRVDAQLNAGPLSVEERAEVVTRYKEGLLSKQTAMILLGVEDWKAEMGQMQEEAREALGDGYPPPPAVPPVPPVEAEEGDE